MQNIDRDRLVRRHNPKLGKFDAYSPLTVGNGEFAFTADITGLQTFPEAYEDSIPLCTQSQWGWHTTPTEVSGGHYCPGNLKPKAYYNGTRPVLYHTSKENQEDLFNWLRENPHRLNLCRISLDITLYNGQKAGLENISNISQELDMWTGILNSCFTVENMPVTVKTCCHPARETLAFCIESPLASLGRLTVKLSFPYGSPGMTASDWQSVDKHRTHITALDSSSISLLRILDKDRYFVNISHDEAVRAGRTGHHEFRLEACESDKMEFILSFSPVPMYTGTDSYGSVESESRTGWKKYWMEGGIVEFAGSEDPRAPELERRMVQSLYLTRVQCAGTLPPQETGLTFNSWYGKFHLEMHFWHSAHFALWGRTNLLERSLWWYISIMDKAEELAKFQGYEGARWPKMTGPDGIDSPSPIGPLLIWQQPHPIYYAELCYRTRPERTTLEIYKDIVFKTADFMASYASYDSEREKYVLGPGLIPAQENHSPESTLNPAFELSYWHFGLKTAEEWARRMDISSNPVWSKVSSALSPLPCRSGVYLAHENCPDTYTKYNHDHPSMLGAFGLLPGMNVDREVMLNTIKTVIDAWRFEEAWGWDFPVMAMCAARLGEPELALDCLLMDTPKNTYLKNGHNAQGTRKSLPIYLPGNGGLLLAVAMMAAGWDNGPQNNAPGFPSNGSWKVRWEGLHRLP